jgi:hypothetical protein
VVRSALAVVVSYLRLLGNYCSVLETAYHFLLERNHETNEHHNIIVEADLDTKQHHCYFQRLDNCNKQLAKVGERAKFNSSKQSKHAFGQRKTRNCIMHRPMHISLPQLQWTSCRISHAILMTRLSMKTTTKAVLQWKRLSLKTRPSCHNNNAPNLVQSIVLPGMETCSANVVKNL